MSPEVFSQTSNVQYQGTGIVPYVSSVNERINSIVKGIRAQIRRREDGYNYDICIDIYIVHFINMIFCLELLDDLPSKIS